MVLKGFLVFYEAVLTSGMHKETESQQQLANFKNHRVRVWYAYGTVWSYHSMHWLYYYNHYNRFTALLPGPPGWTGARRELLDVMVQGKINRGRHNRPYGWAPLHTD